MDNKIKAGFFILGAALVIITAMLFYGISQNAKISDESHRALCGIKIGYITNIRDDNKYLSQHPNGVSGLGFTAKQVKNQIEQSIVRTKIQLDHLKDISCS